MTKASDNQYPKVTFAESAAPSTPSTGLAFAYVKTDGKLYLKDDAGTETDLTATGSAAGWISAFVGTTTATAFYWDGNDLSSSFTSYTPAGSATWTESNNLVSVKAASNGSSAFACQLAAHTFTTGDAFAVPIVGSLFVDGVNNADLWQFGIVFADGTTGASNAVVGHVQYAADTLNPYLVGRHGTLSSASTAPWVSDMTVRHPYAALYVKLTYQAANTFRLEWSPDGISYSAFGESDISKTMTPTHVGLAVSSTDAFDGIAAFGPLIKVA